MLLNTRYSVVVEDCRVVPCNFPRSRQLRSNIITKIEKIFPLTQNRLD